MSKTKKRWMFVETKKRTTTTITEPEKAEVTAFFQPLVEQFKEQFIPKNPDKEYNYLIDIYSKWYRHYFYLCEKFKFV